MPTLRSRAAPSPSSPASSATPPSLHSRVHSTSPTTVSSCNKLSVPLSLLLSVLPPSTFLLNLFSFVLYPTAASRELVCVSQYLYKFTDGGKEKGTPYPLMSVTAKKMTSPSSLLELLYLTSQNATILQLSIPDKSSYYSFSSSEELQLFLDTVKSLRQEAVKREMGHSTLPLTPAEERLDREGRTKWERRQRVRKRVMEGEMKGRDEATERLLS
mmetsp:Transcript_928/g.1653  ORF Transcript_928/g.1653 Transcript_928/m.1653 type:complete len:215 (+) Transcript_928:171-815(+)